MSIPVHYVRCADYRRQTLSAALEKLLPPVLPEISGKKIMLKPNLLDWRKPEDPRCTHPALITELCRYLVQHQAAEVAVIENPAVQTAPAILQRMGIAGELASLGVRMENCSRYETVALPGKSKFHRMELASEFRDFDLVIDLPKAKTHAMMILTLGVKNLFGLVRGSERLGWHLAVGRSYDDFADMLLDLHETVKPQLTVLDAVTGMEGNGPGSGDPVSLGFLAASSSALALDAAVSPRLGVKETPLLLRAAQRRLLPDFTEQGELPECRPIRLPDPPKLSLSWGVWFPPRLRKLLRKIFVSRPVLDEKRCIGCGVCVKMCPPHSLVLSGGRPQFHLKSCIRCYCCQEHCPQGAIRCVKTPAMHAAELLEKFLRKLADAVFK